MKRLGGGFASDGRVLCPKRAASGGRSKMSVGSKGVERATVVVLGTVALLVVAGCSSKEPKPMAQPTPDQVRGHADRGFDNLKQEEKERGTQPAIQP
jgi:hypothetical protein